MKNMVFFTETRGFPLQRCGCHNYQSAAVVPVYLEVDAANQTFSHDLMTGSIEIHSLFTGIEHRIYYRTIVGTRVPPNSHHMPLLYMSR